jgi:hypothetical protein
VGGHAWRDVVASVIALREAIDQGQPRIINTACDRLLTARHNNGLVRDKIVELNNAIGAVTSRWWNESRPGA